MKWPLRGGAAIVSASLVASLACGGNDESPEPKADSGSDSPLLLPDGTGGSTSTGGTGTTAQGASGGSGATSPPVGGSGAGGGGSFFIECLTAADCEPFGGGKVCCDTGIEGFCTKPSACPGATR